MIFSFYLYTSYIIMYYLSQLGFSENLWHLMMYTVEPWTERSQAEGISFASKKFCGENFILNKGARKPRRIFEILYCWTIVEWWSIFELKGFFLGQKMFSLRPCCIACFIIKHMIGSFLDRTVKKFWAWILPTLQEKISKS